MPCSRSCCGADTLNLTQAPALPRTDCTDLPIRAYPQLRRQIAPLRYGRVSGGRTKAVVAEDVRRVSLARISFVALVALLVVVLIFPGIYTAIRDVLAPLFSKEGARVIGVIAGVV